MNDREKLIELLRKGTNYSVSECAKYKSDCNRCPHYEVSRPCGNAIVADYLIANGVTVQKWIPVSERLPDKNDKYIVFLKYVKTITVMNFALDFVVHDEYGLPTKEKKSCFYYCDDDWELIEVPEVTHWMPLPQPPKGEQE